MQALPSTDRSDWARFSAISRKLEGCAAGVMTGVPQ
jgi:hypothetical protein